MSVQFEYEITPETFAAARALLFDATKKGRIISAFVFIGGGGLCLLTARNFASSSSTFVGLAILGVLWISAGVLSLASKVLSGSYETSKVGGKRYSATVDANGFEVVGPDRRWQVKWQSVSVKGEDEHVIMLYARPTVFAFGKQFLTPTQQLEIRQFAGMPQADYVSKSSSA